jgi:predicted ATPase/transcriptional regulator with XRE-family HTH domain
MESQITFGEWLRQKRNELGLTREEFSKRIGCSVSALRKIEDSQRRPSTQIAELIAGSLNIPPTERSTFVKVARGELSVERLAPAPKPTRNISPASTSHINLPVLPTPLIGRQREVDELSQLLRDPQCRLLTLVGPGGIGKTRLAIETASHTQNVFTNGIYFIPLASVNSIRFIVPMIADAVGFAFQGAGSTDPKIQLFGYLKEKQALLLMDNLEHLLAESGIELLAELLAYAPQVKLLATSRESLRLQGEWVFEVQGLPIPQSGTTQNTSVELFLQRARRAHVGFNATLEDHPAILRVCQLVEGMPLGIELAAAWVRTLTCAEIAGEIERGLDFLSVSARDLPPRHRSMRAIFDHSWKLLTEKEQGILLRLSVFKSGFRHEAAESVAGATLSALSALVTKSLVRRSGVGRYDLHELIRQFAAEHFNDRPKERVAMQSHHSNYYLTFFGQADKRLRSSAQRETLAELTAEMDNFRAAWDWALAHGEFALLEQALRTFAMLYDVRGWYQEGIDTLDHAVTILETTHRQSPPDRITQVLLGHILASRSLLASRQGQYQQAQVMLERSMEILRPLNELCTLVESLYSLGTVMELTGNYARALELYSEGLEIATAIGDRWFAALCLTCRIGLVGITQMIVKPEVTYERLQSVVSEWRAIGDPRFTAIGLNSLYWSALRLGQYDEARAALEESIELSILVGDRWVLGFSYRGLGIIAQAQGEHTKAVDMFRKGLDIFTELGARQDVARAFVDMGRSIFALRNEAEAERIWRESLRIAIETRGIFIALEALVGFASLQTKRGDMEQALELLLIVLNHPVITHETRKRAAHLRAELESQLTSQQIEAVHARAQVKTFEAIVDEILKQTPST